ncbi:MAG: chromosome segregation protein SMC [Oscillospiraceae bacterium]|nr:chromosome segregation protein SMC [Oscillospiraceae bacterium]
MNRKALPEEQIAYNKIVTAKNKFGIFHKTCFHVHTPISHDYRLLEEWDDTRYKQATEQEILLLCQTRKAILPTMGLEEINLTGTLEIFKTKKELLSYLLLAKTIVEHEISIVVVADHNVLGGAEKLTVAISELCKVWKKFKIYPQVISGIEISCADKMHVLGILDGKSGMASKVSHWLKENLVNEHDGSYKTSLEVLEFFDSVGAIGYIAHLDTTDIFKEEHLSGAYKKKLLSDKRCHIIGLSNLSTIDYVRLKLIGYKIEDSVFVIDNDSHFLEEIGQKHIWIKGRTCNFAMIREALRDYSVSVAFSEPLADRQQYIKGVYIADRKGAFLSSCVDGEGFQINFSSSLNCIIGGRGTGKSSILKVLEFAFLQRCQTLSELEFICSQGNVWILYIYKGKEFLICFRTPVKAHEDDNILSCFGQNPAGRYTFSYSFNADTIADVTLSKFIEVSEVVHDNSSMYLKPVKEKRLRLNDFFDTSYSVNELVNTASGEKISAFIYHTLFRNRIFSKPNIRIVPRPEISRLLKQIQESLDKRSKEVTEIINQFNAQQKGVLEIQYSQIKMPLEVPIETWLFDSNYSETQWYQRYNVTHQDVIDYLLKLCESLGTLRFLNLLLSGDFIASQKIQRLTNFCTPMTANMVAAGINELSEETAQMLVCDMFSKIVKEKNLKLIIQHLKESMNKTDRFTLMFNINSREGGDSKMIYKDVKTISLGQKVVAMLTFILGYSEFSHDFRPLIIDQPEDNLDNQYIYKNLVSKLRETKDKRQIIIATHNATIVTNAKSDQVIVMESNNEKGWVKSAGFVGEQNVKRDIINYLEGGKPSFLHKVQIYQSALNIPSAANLLLDNNEAESAHNLDDI